MGEKLSEAEAELYDRQIRLWGIESQEKLRASNVLLINVRCLGSEIAKNLMLTGINSLTILDDGEVTEADLANNFLLDVNSVGTKIAEAVIPKAQALNPLVKIEADVGVADKKNADYFSKFTIVVATLLEPMVLTQISDHCRKNGVKFICGDVWGMFGYCLSDFQEHEYYEDQVKMVKGKKRSHDEMNKNSKDFEKVTVQVQNTLSYPEIKSILYPTTVDPKQHKRRNPYYYVLLMLMEFRNSNKRDPCFDSKDDDVSKLLKHKKELCQTFHIDESKIKDDVFDVIYGGMAPIASIVGGIMSQEVIKAVSHKEVPIYNLFLLDPYSMNGREETVKYM